MTTPRAAMKRAVKKDPKPMPDTPVAKDTSTPATEAVLVSPIRGMACTVQDVSTGIDVPFHRIEGYTIDLRNRTASCVVLGFASEDKYKEGRNPIVQSSFNLSGVPAPGSDPLEWLYAHLVTMQKPEGVDDLPAEEKVKYQFSGAAILR